MNAIKPCPACGLVDSGDWTEHPQAILDDDEWYGECPCGVRGPRRLSMEEAISAWNALPRLTVTQVENALHAATPCLKGPHFADEGCDICNVFHRTMAILDKQEAK